MHYKESAKHRLLIEGFVKKCHDMGITDETKIFDLLKLATAPDALTGEEAADKDNESYYEQAGKQCKGKGTTKVDRDQYGLSGDPERTNVGTTGDYAI